MESTETLHETARAGTAEAHTGNHAHPRYLLVWLWLAVLTAAEVSVVAFTALPKSWVVTALLIMAIWKALLVALYFMHLRFEPPRVAVLAASPLPLAVLLVMVVLQEYR
ncbi:MAG: cytochrome C oxidase subunit IV family protein [Gemmatimonadales bacterium]